MKRQHLQPVAVEERNMINLELSLEEVNSILSVLGKAPYEFSQPIIDKIKQQAIPQVQAQVQDVPVEPEAVVQ